MKPEMTEFWTPQPAVVTPGEYAQDGMQNPPSDAIVLFDGTNLDQWISAKDGTSAAPWTVENGYVMVKPGSGDIRTKATFDDFQLHIEWSTPADTLGKTSQGRGNSGVFLQGIYEVQMLDVYNNKTYSNGQAGSIYKQTRPLVNAMRPPMKWNVYDIIYTAPRFKQDGSVRFPARVTVLHNGVVVQNNTTRLGPTEYIGIPQYPPTEKGHSNCKTTATRCASATYGYAPCKAHPSAISQSK